MKLGVAVVLAVAVALSTGATVEHPSKNRIVGGSVTNINTYPFGVALLYNYQGSINWWAQACGGTILNNRSILTAAHCTNERGTHHLPSWWRARVGSTNANSGGTVYLIGQIINHPNYVWSTTNNDVAVLRTSSTIGYIANTVAQGSIAGANYNLGDNQVVWAIGWGTTSSGGASSEQLRHVQVWTINQNTCNQRYGGAITAGMLCSGWLDVGGRDQCQGDSGGPLLHNNVVVGVCSWGSGCASSYYPGVNARVSVFANWIIANA